MNLSKFSLLGGEIFTPNQVRLVDLHIDQGRTNFLQAGSAISQVKTIDVSNCYVTPGLVDLQVNGSTTCNLWDNPNKEEFHSLCQELLKAGTTTFLPTLITAEIDDIKRNIRFLESVGVGKQRKFSQEPGTNGDITSIFMPGIHLEGPFISSARPGVHPRDCIQELSIDHLKEVISPLVKLMTIAPEYEQGEAAIKFLIDKGVTVSLGHSNANFEQAQNAFKWGIKLVTHLFNAMPPLHHRDCGAVGAALLNDQVSCCLIADGLHLNEHMVELILRLKGTDKVILVTDIAHVGTNKGGLVGSSIMLSEAVCNLVNWGIATFQDAIKMATFNAAQAINMHDQIGLIKEDGPADLVVWDKNNLEIRHVIANGELVF